MSFSRVTRAMLPASKCLCRVNNWCVYRSKYDSCDNPRINKGNSDAACWRLSNKALLTVLITLPVRTDHLGNSQPDPNYKQMREAFDRLHEGNQVEAIMKNGGAKKLSVEYVTDDDDISAHLAFTEVDGDGEEILLWDIASFKRVEG